MTGWNLPPGCRVSDLPGFADDEDESPFWCDACEDTGWLECCDSGHLMVIPCTECSGPLTIDDLDELGEATQ